MKVASLIAAAVLVISGSAALAAEQPGTGNYLPPEDMIIHILDTHPMVLEAEAKLNAAEADARRMRAGEHEFVLEGEYVRRDVGAGEIVGRGNYNEWNIGVSRAIRLPAKARADRTTGQLGVDVAEYARDDARHQTALLFKDQWLDWLEATALLRIDEAEAETYRQELAAVQRRLDLKGASQLDLEQAKVALATAESSVTESRRASDAAALALQHTFPELVLPHEAPSLPDPQALQGDVLAWRKMVIDHSHELAMAEKDAERAMSAAHRASLDRVADPTIGFRTFQERGGDETGIGVSVSIPLGFARRRAISDTMRAEAVAASVREQSMRREIALVADRDITNMTATVNAWKQAASARAASDDVVGRMRRAVELGDRDFSELLLTLRQHFEVQRSEERERAAAHRALLQFQIDAHQIWGLHHEDT